jgi:hypothetical protein
VPEEAAAEAAAEEAVPEEAAAEAAAEEAVPEEAAAEAAAEEAVPEEAAAEAAAEEAAQEEAAQEEAAPEEAALEKEPLQIGSLLFLLSRKTVGTVLSIGADGARVAIFRAPDVFTCNEAEYDTIISMPLEDARAALLTRTELAPSSRGAKIKLFGSLILCAFGKPGLALSVQRTGHPQIDMGGGCSLADGVYISPELSFAPQLYFAGAWKSKSSSLSAVVLAQVGQSNQLALFVVPFSALSINKAVFMPMLQFLPILEQVRSWPIVVA